MSGTSFGTWLDSKSDEFATLRNYLTLCLHGRIVTSLEIWKIENESSSAFEKRAGEKLCLPCWSKVPGEARDLKELCETGAIISSTQAGLKIGIYTQSI
jgi:hypothetical protein